MYLKNIVYNTNIQCKVVLTLMLQNEAEKLNSSLIQFNICCINIAL